MFTTALLAATLTAPVPTDKTVELYFPTVEGTKWVVKTTQYNRMGSDVTEATIAVTKVVEKDGKYTVTTSSDANGKTTSGEIEVSAKGVFNLSNANGKLAEPIPLIKLPAKEGDAWKFELESKRESGIVKTTFTRTVGKEEEVEVPAGKFKAFPIIQEYEEGGRTIKSKVWVAKGVGVVKTEGEISGHSRITELKEFTPGKAK